MTTMDMDRELKKGSTALLILSLLEARPRHGYDIGQQIERRSQGVVQLRVASLYPLLYRLERRGWVTGRWVERSGERRRRYYRLTPAGRRILADQKDIWRAFVAAVNRVVRTSNA
jgi:transcriptional regulator